MHADFWFSKSEYMVQYVIITDDNLHISYGANKWYLHPSVLIYFTWPLSPTLEEKKELLSTNPTFSNMIKKLNFTYLAEQVGNSDLLSWVAFILRMENSGLPSGDGLH